MKNWMQMTQLKKWTQHDATTKNKLQTKSLPMAAKAVSAAPQHASEANPRAIKPSRTRATTSQLLQRL
jgi:hypothetical protein